MEKLQCCCYRYDGVNSWKSKRFPWKLFFHVLVSREYRICFKNKSEELRTSKLSRNKLRLFEFWFKWKNWRNFHSTKSDYFPQLTYIIRENHLSHLTMQFIRPIIDPLQSILNQIMKWVKISPSFFQIEHALLFCRRREDILIGVWKFHQKPVSCLKYHKSQNFARLDPRKSSHFHRSERFKKRENPSHHIRHSDEKLEGYTKAA